jgi:GNAT superfamily N-acetyltransferase
MSPAELPTVPRVPGRVVPLGVDDTEELRQVDAAAFVFPLDDEPDFELSAFEWDRTFGVRSDDGDLVGISTTYSLTLALPSGPPGPGTTTVPMAGLSWVAVHPGYRRRGVLSAMIQHHLHEVHDRGGEALSGLHASEAGIYGRFGYGLATAGMSLSLGRGASLRDLPEAEDDVRVRFDTVDADRHVDLVADLHRRACALRPGMVHAPLAKTRADLHQSKRQLRDDEPLRLLVAERGGTATGFAIIRRTVSWTDGSPDGSTRVLQLVALDLPTERRLWQTVTDFDLTSTTTAWRLPPDHPLLSWLVDPRSAKPTRIDDLWLRVVDVERALAERGYAGDLDVVLDLTDELCPWNAGRWRLRGGPDAASCARTHDDADLALDVRELGSVLVGGVTVSALHRAGLLRERSPGAADRLSVAMRAAVEPATTYGF